ncbi:hypothetical protein L6J37_04980 [Photobacterium sp. WH77]|uniref:hypothetical protein n=1 Tax=unclassified Photobacterium TaxID=2628852 RepID=UPI001ED9F0A1|nr:MULTISPECIES: hypothetical protein [unclassified Photobacterium]MCG2836214.1 hypothetical protein [Photobacterium sp. WH77]MCG2843649.1 hypothetical protein [Photobacterium sp. WH80]
MNRHNSNKLTLVHIDKDHPLREKTESYVASLSTICHLMGLGMSIIRNIAELAELAELHGGSISLEPQSSAGKNGFQVTFPLKTGHIQ